MNKDKNTVNVLLVDDDPELLRVTKQIIEAEKEFNVETASSVEEANTKLMQKTYDVIVSDYEMPIKNGLQFLEELNNTQNKIPFILFTGKGREEVAIKALNLGAGGYVNKHGDPETVFGELAHCIRQNVERKRAETALIESEERLKAIVQNAPIGIATANAHRQFISANSKFCSILGYEEEEIRKLTFKDLTYPDDISESILKMEDLSTGSIPFFMLEKRYIRKDGKIIYGEITVSAIRNQQGKPCFFIAELEDISERKKAEQGLREQKDKAERYLNIVGNIILALDPHGRVTLLNKRGYEILGYAEGELEGKDWVEICLPENERDTLRTLFKDWIQNKILSPGCFENHIVTKKGEKRRISWFNTLLIDADGKVIGSLSSGEDITDRKKAEEALLQEHGKLNAIAEHIGAGIVIVSKDYHIIYANKVIKDIRGEVEGKLCYSTLNNLNFICPDCSVKKVFEQNKLRDAHEYLSVHSQGERWIELVATPLKDSNGNTVAALEIALDITEKKQKEKELEESQHKFKALFSENPAAICFADTNYNIIEINSKFTALFGYVPEEIVGKNLFETIIPVEESKTSRTFISQITDHAVSFNSVRRRKDGSKVNVSVSIGPVIAGDKKIGYIGVYSDISYSIIAQKTINKALKDTLAAQQQLAATLKKTELLNDKLNVIGSFTRHDVRNKLMTLNGNAYLAKKHAKDKPALMANLDRIEAASRSIVRILEFAKAYEALGSQALTPTDVGKAIDEAVSLFADLNGVTITNQCTNLNVMADQMLTTIFHNLIDNSLRHGEKLTQIKIYPQKTPEGALKIIYEDDGVGIPLDIKEQLFEKGAGKGTGYGLYLIKRTCDIYGWISQETGEPGKGAKFEFTLPAHEKQ